MTEAEQMKRCYRCKTEKPVTDFYRSSHSKDGRQGRCKPCDHAIHCDQARNNRPRFNAYAARYREARRQRLGKGKNS